MKVLLVTGGNWPGRVDSTELLLPSATSWSYSAGLLPSIRSRLTAATLKNKVLVTGTLIIIHHDLFYILHNAGILDDVLEYDEEKQEWNKVGTLTMRRENHAVSVINYNSIKDYCN